MNLSESTGESNVISLVIGACGVGCVGVFVVLACEELLACGFESEVLFGNLRLTVSIHARRSWTVRTE